MVDAQSLEIFKFSLDWALSNMMELKMSLLTAVGLNHRTFKGPFHSKLFYDYNYESTIYEIWLI